MTRVDPYHLKGPRIKCSDVMTRTVQPSGRVDRAGRPPHGQRRYRPILSRRRQTDRHDHRPRIAVRGIAKGYGPDTLVRDLMSDDLICAREDDDIESAAARMSEAQVRRLLVIDDQERLCGVVSLGDLSRETGGETANVALEGVSQPGSEHRQ